MSNPFKAIGKVFKKVVKVVKKIALPAIMIGAAVLTGGAALGLLPSVGSMLGAGGLGLSAGLTSVISSAGTGALNNLWKAKSVATHNSLLLKKGSLAFWYNKGALELLQALKPYGDYTENALHLYCCAHRYVRLPNEPRSGVVKVRHNANGL